jgi:tRNA A-37 threonylcarbamoyl transferase component Bud32
MTLEARALLDVAPSQWLRRVPGRETFAWPQMGRPEMVVKRMDGRDWREDWRERFRGRGARSPGRREYEILSELAEQGFPVPRALGWAEDGRGGAERSLVVMEYVPHASNLRERIEREPDFDCVRWSRRLLELVIRMHEGGWYHRDLYLQHFLALEDPPRLVLLDVGRARKETRARERWFVKDLAALLHSSPQCLRPFAALRFLARYLDGRGIHRPAERRAWARAIGAHERRMSRHRPRHGEADER